MASSSASKPIQKILDSTKIASLSKFVRKPPVDPSQPIEGRRRNPSSNAFKEHVRRESVRLQKALNSITHGKHIFVYHNVRTKQVVYSLTRYLEVSLGYFLSQELSCGPGRSVYLLQSDLIRQSGKCLTTITEEQPPPPNGLPWQKDRSR
jgi:hypothetical protein